MQMLIKLRQNLSLSLSHREHELVLKLNALDAEQKSHILELESEIAACHTKESELLGFTEKMTTHDAHLQSEISAVQAKVSV